jgi:hypothetical protein
VYDVKGAKKNLYAFDFLNNHKAKMPENGGDDNYIWIISLNSQYKPAATKAETGMVNSQAMARSPTTPQRTLFTRSAAPTPMMDELTTCVVLTGPPSKEALRITATEAS